MLIPAKNKYSGYPDRDLKHSNISKNCQTTFFEAEIGIKSIFVPEVSYFPSAKSAEISEDLFFNSRPKNYLSPYRRNEGSAALEIFLRKVPN